MFLSALTVGRLWCGWACPAGALQEFGSPINTRPTPGGKFNWISWPCLRLRSAPNKCSDSQTCTRNCPMSLAVNGLVQRADMEGGECILCDNCVHGCPKDAISFSFSAR